jgi:hypothetical protein
VNPEGKGFLIAVRALPVDYVRENTNVVITKDGYLCYNPELPMLFLKRGEFQWEETPDDAA